MMPLVSRPAGIVSLGTSAPAQGVGDLEVAQGAASRPGSALQSLALGNARDRHFGAFAAVAGRIDGYRGREAGGAGRVLFPVAGVHSGHGAPGLQVVVLQRHQVPGGFFDHGGQVAVGEGEGRRHPAPGPRAGRPPGRRHNSPDRRSPERIAHRRAFPKWNRECRFHRRRFAGKRCPTISGNGAARNKLMSKRFGICTILSALGALTSLALTAAGPAAPGNSRITGPYTHENLSIFLVHSAGNATGRKLLTLQEAMDQKKTVVYETGSVNQLAIENQSSEEVYIQAGDIVKGGQQDRVLITDILLPAHSGKLPISSFCVEQGRWSKRGAEAADQFGSSNARVAGKALKMAVMDKKDQGQVWDQVALEREGLAMAAPIGAGGGAGAGSGSGSAGGVGPAAVAPPVMNRSYAASARLSPPSTSMQM